MLVFLAIPVLVSGVSGLLWAYAPEATLSLRLNEAMFNLVAKLIVADLPDALDIIHPDAVEEILAGVLRFVLAPVGVMMILAAGMMGRDSEIADMTGESGSFDSGLVPVEKSLAKRALKRANALARKGEFNEAAEILFSVDMMDKAAEFFIKAEDFVRAAEIRHDQNRFLECAELYLQGGNPNSAATIYGQQEEWQKSAECHLETGNRTQAAEMFEKAEDFFQAAQCYRKAEFQRHAAQCYVKSKAWRLAAECLEEVIKEEGANTLQNDPKVIADMNRLVGQAGKLYMRAKEPELAMEILRKGGLHAEAGDVALKLQRFAEAASLFRDAGQLPRAADALRELGETEAAARILGEHHRDLGEIKEAAGFLEEAGDFLDAGDFYRQLEDYERAGHCYKQQGGYAQAAEMYRASGNRDQAAECFELAERFVEAAECWALAGQPAKEAELLEKGDDFLAAGEVYHREGIDEKAISALQKVEPEDIGFPRASALLGDIFRSRGQLSLAIKKLQQAIGDDELSRENLEVFYSLGLLNASNNRPAEAVEIFEKILAFDYHYRDVEQRVIEARDLVAQLGPVESQDVSSAARSVAGGGSQPGRYQIVGELGRGGMGIVYKAKDTALDRIVAYKVLPDTLAENQLALKNFMREAKAAAKLNHPGIVTVYDTGEQDGRYYIAMEYVDGTTLKEIIRRRGVISPAGILHVLVQVSEALAYAHENRVVHRDIKSANTMWTRDKKAKIMDFGLAKVVEEVRNHTTVVSGTPYYMSPEQTLGRNIDHRTDIYSLGVTMFEMATGTVPFKEGNIPYHHVHTPPPDVRELRPELPAGLAAVVNRCLQKDPAARYQSAREILREVKASMGQVTAAGKAAKAKSS
ncbi:MAG: tetratricopeptide (TPR) repeat protein [Myxococcota bacterium]|jgi:tetratricopeptide (TPR) repeat protein